jgi:ABC-type Fe2+-enterobactin transport system substrate-binding protein
MAPLAAAAPYITIGTSIMQYQQQGVIGKYNQKSFNRSANVLEGQAAQIEQKAEFDIAQFNKTYQKVKGETTVALAKSGVQIGSGSAYNIALSNALEKRLQENLIYYNSRVAAANKREEASFARIKGKIAKQESKLAQISTIASAGTTLMTMDLGSFGTKSYNQGAGSSKSLFTSNSVY